MNQFLCFCLWLSFTQNILCAQEIGNSWSSPLPTSSDMLAQGHFGNGPSAHQAYLSMQTLPAFNLATVLHCGMLINLDQQKTKLGFYGSVLHIGPYQEFSSSLLLRKEFSPLFAAWLRPSWQRVAVRAYGGQSSFGGELGMQYRYKTWTLAAVLEKQSFIKGHPSSLTFSSLYQLSSAYSLNLFMRQRGMQAMAYGLELNYSKEKKCLILGMGTGMHMYFRFQIQKARHGFLFSLHYSPVWSFAPENAYHYAW